MYCGLASTCCCFVTADWSGMRNVECGERYVWSGAQKGSRSIGLVSHEQTAWPGQGWRTVWVVVAVGKDKPD